MSDKPSDVTPTEPQKTGAMRDLGPRLLSAIVMVVLALGSAWLGGHVFALFWMVAGFAVFWEWQKMVGGRQERYRLIVGAVALAVAAQLALTLRADIALLVVLVGAIVVALLAGREKALWAGPGLVYAGALVISVCVLRSSFFEGLTSILWVFAVVWGTDVMAYFGGRLIGGPKLWPRISPGKTWSGLICGVVCGAGLGVCVVQYWRTAGEINLLPVFLVGIAAGLAAQGGDLFESGMKRHFGVKDSSHLIPGHGGAMDRLDGFIVAVTLAAIIGLARNGFYAPARGLLVWW
ncbi:MULTISPECIES: phosphatidate cytidylyltransferase [unclassified Beijerinckia]|uniref:phosphatidate cytidylyltransferase n=1 Tax=unclassified Beijerinckia TaxID=2638183 RepID=UPI001FCDC70D|nr:MULTISPECIES: phosphatidate cytidylyltransferase [unclassified Beijerinckia]